MRNDFEKAMRFRHACKLFDSTRSMTTEDLEFILDAGRMSPSSLGLEHWKFLVVRDVALKEKIRPLAWNQPQVMTCSELIVILYKKELRSDTSYTKSQFRRNYGVDEVPDAYKGFIDSRTQEELFAWSAKQTYIAASNMMTAAASIGIDSCPMEGFDYAAVENVLAVDTKKYGIALMLPLGYRAKEQQPRHRSDLSDLVSYL